MTNKPFNTQIALVTGAKTFSVWATALPVI